MKTTDVNESIIGKRCKSIFTGMMVTGTITEINITKHSTDVKVHFDNPHNWGNEWYEGDWSSARLQDEFGSLEFLEIIDNTYVAVKITFTDSISDINKMFINDYGGWQVVNLKEWIDNYESSRFTQIGEFSAIITSEYNMDCITEWLSKYTLITTIETLI